MQALVTPQTHEPQILPQQRSEGCPRFFPSRGEVRGAAPVTTLFCRRNDHVEPSPALYPHFFMSLHGSQLVVDLFFR